MLGEHTRTQAGGNDKGLRGSKRNQPLLSALIGLLGVLSLGVLSLLGSSQSQGAQAGAVFKAALSPINVSNIGNRESSMAFHAVYRAPRSGSYAPFVTDTPTNTPTSTSTPV